MKDFTNYANSFQAIARLGLESIGNLMKQLGNPERELKFIHISGTNGKGSISAFLQNILTDSGIKCGKYISPNMLSVCERISVDGKDISEAEMEVLMQEVASAAEKVKAELNTYPTQFEIWTAAAFLYFKKTNCGIVVLETGLGGRKDATNIIPPPELSVIAHISSDHTEYLGNNLAEIAFEKAGIIKDHGGKVGYTISAIQAPEAATVLEKACRERNNKLITAQKCRSVSHSSNGEIFDYGRITNLTSRLLGVHQRDNAAVAIEAALTLGIDERFIRSGIEKSRNMGRFEILSKKPLILFDGAHNPASMRALAEGVNRYFPEQSKTIIIATMADKDISSSLEELKKTAKIKEVFALSVRDNPRAMPAEKLAEILWEHGLPAAAKQSFADITPSGDMTVICGSLYLYKDYFDTLKG